MAYSFPLSAQPAFFSEQHAFLVATAAVSVDFSLLAQDFPSDFPSEQHAFFVEIIAVDAFFDAQWPHFLPSTLAALQQAFISDLISSLP
jgi:hypothetical protein